MCEGIAQDDRVRWKGNGESGVVHDIDGTLAQVSMADGVYWVPCVELERIIDEPLREGILGQSEPYSLRLLAQYLKHAYRYDPLSGLSNARIEPTLHQVYVAHRVVGKLQPRMILADEVGLGKTIEAGLVLKELRARELVDRVLIIVPASLQLQWQHELQSKFNEEFHIIDGPAARFLERGGANPWKRYDNIICSMTFASRDERMGQIVEADWDLVIFDEAHKVRRSMQSADRTQTTRAYRLADDLKETSTGLLLLTATPMQLHPFELYSLIELVEPGLFADFNEYEQRRKDLPALNRLMKELKEWGALSRAEQESAADEHATLLLELGVDPEEAIELLGQTTIRQRTIELLVDRHPLADVLIRNRKAEIGGFTKREPNRVLVELTEHESQLYEDVTEYIRWGYNLARRENNLAVGFLMVLYQKLLSSSSYALRTSFRKRLEKLDAKLQEIRDRRSPEFESVSGEHIDELREAEELSLSLDELEQLAADEASIETEIRMLSGLVDRLGKVRDSKALELLKALDVVFGYEPDEKVLIFTQFIQTQMFLQATLARNGYSVALFNGQMNVDEKERSVRRFRDTAQIMITTEAGGEGRNFQFCHVMVNYDLPWNPMKVEQRIGRLDRIGQKKPVFIYNLACAETVEERVLDVLENRIGLFEESVGSLDPILGEVEGSLEELIFGQIDRFDEAYDEYAQRLERQVREANERERVLADFILDHASLRRDQANALLNRRPMADSRDLRSFLGDCLAYYGGTVTDHADGGQVISLSPRLARRLRFRKEVWRGVFDPQLALEMEDLDFFAVGHELVDSLIQLAASAEDAQTGARGLNDAQTGVTVEVAYEIEGVALKPSGAFIRHVIDPSLKVTSERVATLPEIGLPLRSVDVPAWVGDALDASQRRFNEEVEAEKLRLNAENEAAKQAELDREDRIYRYRMVRLEKRIEDDLSMIERIERSTSEGERRILPAIRGRLNKNRERRDRLTAEHETNKAAIAAREPAVRGRTISMGLVVGA